VNENGADSTAAPVLPHDFTMKRVLFVGFNSNLSSVIALKLRASAVTVGKKLLNGVGYRHDTHCHDV
jgi:hypothetical protein